MQALTTTWTTFSLLLTMKCPLICMKSFRFLFPSEGWDQCVKLWADEGGATYQKQQAGKRFIQNRPQGQDKWTAGSGKHNRRLDKLNWTNDYTNWTNEGMWRRWTEAEKHGRGERGTKGAGKEPEERREHGWADRGELMQVWRELGEEHRMETAHRGNRARDTTHTKKNMLNTKLRARWHEADKNATPFSHVPNITRLSIWWSVCRKC